MTKPKYDIFALKNGELSKEGTTDKSYIEDLSNYITEESLRMVELYQAEIEIVQSILQQAAEEESNRSTD